MKKKYIIQNQEIIIKLLHDRITPLQERCEVLRIELDEITNLYHAELASNIQLTNQLLIADEYLAKIKDSEDIFLEVNQMFDNFPAHTDKA